MSNEHRRYIVFEDQQAIIKAPESFSLGEIGENAVYTTVSTRIRPKASPDHPEQGYFFLNYHLERLTKNAASLNLLDPTLMEHQRSWIEDQVLHQTAIFLKESTCKEKPTRLRLIITPSSLELHLDHFISPWHSRKGIAVVPFTGQRKNAAVKSTRISLSTEARNYAQANGADEALLISEEGYLLEGAFSNIFWFSRDGELLTPKTGMLPGIIRRIILEHFPVTQKDVLYQEFTKNVSEAFITHSTNGIRPIESIDHQPLKESASGSRTQKLLAEFNALVLEQTQWISLDE